MVHNQGTKYTAKVSLDPTGATPKVDAEDAVEEISTDGGSGAASDVTGGDESAAAAEAGTEGNIIIDLPEFKVHLLPMSALSGEVLTKSKYRGKFTAAYFSHSQAHHLKPEVKSALAPGCSVILEHVKFMLDLKPESKAAYLGKMTAFATAVGLTAVGKHDATVDTHFKFKY
jgi:hypothetical protein